MLFANNELPSGLADRTQCESGALNIQFLIESRSLSYATKSSEIGQFKTPLGELQLMTI
jgi:hypothetical protein